MRRHVYAKIIFKQQRKKDTGVKRQVRAVTRRKQHTVLYDMIVASNPTITPIGAEGKRIKFSELINCALPSGIYTYATVLD
jgi:hypothetical protein